MHPAELAEVQTLQSIAESLRAAAHGGRRAIVESGAARLGVSVQTLYSRLRKLGLHDSGRKVRTDRGETCVPDDEVRAVAAMLQSSRSATGKRRLPVEDAMKVARCNGVLTVDCSTTTLLRQMRRLGCHPTQLSQAEPHVEMRSKHPNHVWQLDASICVLYYLRGGKAAVMDERKFNARKPRDMAGIATKRILRYAVTDHYSGTVYARYYHTAGEDQETLFDFLMHAMQRDPQRVIHGVPWMLVWDAGSANQAHAIDNLLFNMLVRHWAHLPGNPRAKGQVEGVHNVIERKFEGRLTFTQIDSVEQLNAHLDVWLKGFNGAHIHRRHGHTRSAVWQTIREDQLRLAPDVATCAALMTSAPQPRRVAGNLTISFAVKGHGSATYSVAHVPGVRVGDQVEVIVNPYRAPAVWIIQRADDNAPLYIECTPIQRDAGGFAETGPVWGEQYAAPADTDVDTARKAANLAAYGERETRDAQTAKAKGRVAFEGTIDPFKDLREAAEKVPEYMARRGSRLDVPNPMHVELQPLSLVDMLRELRARLGRNVRSAEREAVEAWFPDGCDPAEIDGLVARVQQLSETAAGAPPATDDMPRLRAV